MSEVLIKLPCFVNIQHMWSLLNFNNCAEKFKKCVCTSLNQLFLPPQTLTRMQEPTHIEQQINWADGACKLQQEGSSVSWRLSHKLDPSQESLWAQGQDQSRTWRFWFHDAMEHGVRGTIWDFLFPPYVEYCIHVQILGIAFWFLCKVTNLSVWVTEEEHNAEYGCHHS